MIKGRVQARVPSWAGGVIFGVAMGVAGADDTVGTVSGLYEAFTCGPEAAEGGDCSVPECPDGYHFQVYSEHEDGITCARDTGDRECPDEYDWSETDEMCVKNTCRGDYDLTYSDGEPTCVLHTGSCDVDITVGEGTTYTPYNLRPTEGAVGQTVELYIEPAYRVHDTSGGAREDQIQEVTIYWGDGSEEVAEMSGGAGTMVTHQYGDITDDPNPGQGFEYEILLEIRTTSDLYRETLAFHVLSRDQLQNPDNPTADGARGGQTDYDSRPIAEDPTEFMGNPPYRNLDP